MDNMRKQSLAVKDPFYSQNCEFERLLFEAKKNENFRLAYLVEASRLKNKMGPVNIQNKALYDTLVDEEVYSHFTRRLNELIQTIRGNIHNKEYDKAAIYLSDMRMLGDFVRTKKIKFDFEFYDKIDAFFEKRKKKDVNTMPIFK